jgi:myo-inositol-1(or 4)-monophosphatase
MHPMLTFAVKAARRAGAIINRASFDLDKLTVTSKRHNDFVSEVDRAAEDAIIETLRDAYPDHGILAEESGESSGKKKGIKSEYLWIIDPLDGTTNFLHGFPQYCVSIALQQKGVITQAVVFDPTRNELFTATRGRGAYMNEHRLRVSKTRELKDSLLGTGFPFRDFDRLDLYMHMFKTLTQKTAGLRRPGSAALDLAYVAAGRLDGFWEMGLAPWDMAAGSLLVQEAGGLITDLHGKDDWLTSGDLVCGTPKVFTPLLQTLMPMMPK